MKFAVLALLAFSASLLVLACKSTRYTPENLPAKQLRWGTGGGFVGKETAHTLLENGQIFAQDIMGKTTSAGKTKAKKAIALFKSAEALGLDKMDFQHPANIYSFIELRDGDTVSRIVWGDASYPVSKPVEALFHQLNKEGMKDGARDPINK
jgi:hypothetical protein